METNGWSNSLTEFEYNCIDTLATARNHEEMLREDRQRGSFLFDQAILGPSITMQLRGTRVDRAKMKLAEEETLDEARDLQRQFETAVGHKVKWGKSVKPSPAQLAEILYREMGVRVRTAQNGAPTVNKEAISSILEDQKTPDAAVRVAEIQHELAVLEEDQKLLRKPIRETGRMHSTWTVAGTTSGRFSCKQDEYGFGANQQALNHRLHKIFVPDDGYVFINIDQKQAESRGVAYLAGCERYKAMHLQGNVHVQVGELVYPDVRDPKHTALPWDENKYYYDLFKRLQHASNYGQSPFGMARHAHMKVDEATRIQNKYFEELPEIRDWQAEIANQLRVYHSLTTPLGRRRQFLGRTWDDSLVKEAIADVPQSMISQLNKIITWRIWNHFDPQRAQILMEGHDSNLFQVRIGDTETVDQIIDLCRIDVPIRGDTMRVEVEAQWGYSWAKSDLKDYEGKL